MTDKPRPRVRTREPFRAQGVIRFEMPEDTLPPEHRPGLKAGAGIERKPALWAG